MIALFTIITIVFALVRVLFGYFSSAVSWFEPLLTPLTVVAAVAGSIAGLMVLIKICGEIKKLFGKKKKKDDEE